MSASQHRRQMVARYPEFVESCQPRHLDASQVPPGVREYIPYAELWGVVDDLERELRVERAPAAALEDLADLIARIDDDLDDWLAGPEADNPAPSSEYVAFSAMRMATDFA